MGSESARYIDLQVNGYAGVDFNGDDIQLPELVQACERLRADGVASILATVITDDLSRMCRRLSNIARLRHQEDLIRDVIRGFHIEGPFLNETKGYIGAHPAEFAKPANRDDMNRLLEAADGLTRIVTLAPERDLGGGVTRHLATAGITVSAGHCNPTRDELAAAIEQGLSMFTHLGNGCPLQMHRHDNIIQRALSLSEKLHIGFIADGVHVPLFALQNYLQCAGIERCFVVTDAIAAAGQGPGVYELAGQTVVVDENLATWAEDRSHLIGSASTMPHLVHNLRSIHLSDHDIERLTVNNPKQAARL